MIYNNTICIDKHHPPPHQSDQQHFKKINKIFNIAHHPTHYPTQWKPKSPKFIHLSKNMNTTILQYSILKLIRYFYFYQFRKPAARYSQNFKQLFNIIESNSHFSFIKFIITIRHYFTCFTCIYVDQFGLCTNSTKRTDD